MNPEGANPVGAFKYSEEVRAKAVEMFQAGKKPDEIGVELGCSGASVYVWATAAGVRSQRTGPSKPGPKPGQKVNQTMSAEERDTLILTMFKQGLVPAVIRKQLGIKGAGTVGNVIRKHGLNPYENTPSRHIPSTGADAMKPEQTNLALPLSPAEQMLAVRAARAQPAPANEDVHALRRTIAALRTERDALRAALDAIIGQ